MFHFILLFIERLVENYERSNGNKWSVKNASKKEKEKKKLYYFNFHSAQDHSTMKDADLWTN